METARAFAVIDRLVELFRAAAAPGGDLEGVVVEDSWPAGRINSRNTVIVADATGAQSPATMRPGGGTRDDTFTVEVACAAVKRTGEAKEARDRAAEMQAAVERIVHRELRDHPGALFGVSGLYRASMIEYDIRQFAHDKGRECDVHLRVQCRARLVPPAA